MIQRTKDEITTNALIRTYSLQTYSRHSALKTSIQNKNVNTEKPSYKHRYQNIANLSENAEILNWQMSMI